MFKLIFLRIIIPPILCAIILSINTGNYLGITYFPIIFGAVIGVFNWGKSKYNSIASIFLSIIISVIIFYAAFYSTFIVELVTNLFKDSNSPTMVGRKFFSGIELIIAVSIIAPLLVFYAYKFLYKIPNSKFSTLIILISIAIIFYVWHQPEKYNIILNPFILWQAIMALALQLTIHQKNFIPAKNNLRI